jgi:hypothetical protein
MGLVGSVAIYMEGAASRRAVWVTFTAASSVSLCSVHDAYVHTAFPSPIDADECKYRMSIGARKHEESIRPYMNK